jgi:hypothetical protein
MMKIILIGIILLSSFLGRADDAISQEPSENHAKQKVLLSRSQKFFLLNASAIAGVALYGIFNWDYGSSGFATEKEGWFKRTSDHGGGDKLGHFWASYAGSHFFSYIYRSWGYTAHQANTLGVLSALGTEVFIEVADGFSGKFGFSYEDLLMDLLGAGAGYLWGRYPRLAEKIDFRIEYIPKFDSDDLEFFTNYDRQRYLIALKAEGFDEIKSPYLKYLELHVGYYVRGYEDFSSYGPDDRKRTVFVGLGFNLSRLLQQFVRTKVLNYFQIPYTSLRLDFHLD